LDDKFKPRYGSSQTPTTAIVGYKAILAIMVLLVLLTLYFYHSANNMEEENAALSAKLSAASNVTFTCPEYTCTDKILTAELTAVYQQKNTCITLLQAAAEARDQVVRDGVRLQQQCWGTNKNDTNFQLWDCNAKLDLCEMKCGGK